MDGYLYLLLNFLLFFQCNAMTHGSIVVGGAQEVEWNGVMVFKENIDT